MRVHNAYMEALYLNIYAYIMYYVIGTHNNPSALKLLSNFIINKYDICME